MGGRHGGALRRGITRKRNKRIILPTHCPWCVAEAGERWPARASGRVCQRHAATLMHEMAIGMTLTRRGDDE